MPSKGTVQLQSAAPTSPILSLLTRHPRSLAKYCQDAGFVVRPIVPPTVPEGGQRVRVCLHATNTVHEVDGLVDCILGWFQAEESKHPNLKHVSRRCHEWASRHVLLHILRPSTTSSPDSSTQCAGIGPRHRIAPSLGVASEHLSQLETNLSSAPSSLFELHAFGSRMFRHVEITLRR